MVKRRKSQKKKIYWLAIILLLIGAGIVTYLVWDNYFKPKDEKKDETEVVKVEERVEEKEKAGEQEGDNESQGSTEREKEKEQVTAYEGEDPNTSKVLTGVVTYAGVSPDGGELVVRVNIDQYLGEGSCELKLLTEGNIIYSETANIINSASTATCEGFNVPVGSFSGGKKYQIVINVESGDRRGVINGEVEI